MTSRIHIGDCRTVLASLPEGMARTCVTSPPYFGLRDYGVAGQIGLESTVEGYVAELVAVFREVRRVLTDDGTLWLNLGDSYAGSWGAQGKRESPGEISRNSIRNHPKRASHTGAIRDAGLKPKDLIGIPWRVAFALQADGWYLRQDIIWAKPNPMPESVTDRPTKAHEYLFLLSKKPRYYYDAAAIAEPATQPVGTPRLTGQHKADAGGFTSNGRRGSTLGTNQGATGRNKRSVWMVATQPFSGAQLLADYVGPDGKPYKVSPDCPVHGLPAYRQTRPRTSGMSSQQQPPECNCSVVDTDHFATMPPKLIEPCILAGTSERGQCPACRAPWVRVVERDVAFTSGSGRAGNIPNGKYKGTEQADSGDYDIRMGPSVSTRTVGWEPSCACGLDPVPDVVVDPFGGAGTTGLVAERLGRDSVLIELNESYSHMAKARIEGDAPLFAGVEVSR